ncbi:hypothetical protein RclHR1_16920003 [Rhizophagus clarus]|uniref:Retrotransposon gag domain-containing protein n=1 Tax=Rhizophagus clarus TaxID=94130 RepID=A0A2Z6QIT2_9GLOM|nr:hypothetical protein RclHR1_16920003 [Rhizophagus clarus]
MFQNHFNRNTLHDAIQRQLGLTNQHFEEVAYSVNTADIDNTIHDLIFSIRYADIELIDYTQLRQDFINAYNITNRFQQDPNEVLYQISETTTSPEPENLSDTKSDTSEENIHQFHIPLPPVYNTLNNPVPALPITLPNTNNALVGNTQAINNPPRREERVAELPYFYGGNQDPVAWLEDFTRACNANGIANGQKLEVVPAYLRGVASTWWNANQALPYNNQNRITAWTGNNNTTDFIQNFPATFRTQTLELYRRVEMNAFAYPEAIKARKFVNGLLPDLYITVKPHNDQTWNGAVDQTKAYELTHQDQGADLIKQVQTLSYRNRGNRNNNGPNLPINRLYTPDDNSLKSDTIRSIPRYRTTRSKARLDPTAGIVRESLQKRKRYYELSRTIYAAAVFRPKKPILRIGQLLAMNPKFGLTIAKQLRNSVVRAKDNEKNSIKKNDEVPDDKNTPEVDDLIQVANTAGPNADRTSALYCEASIKHIKFPLIVDSGSAGSIISLSLLKDLDMEITKASKTVMVNVNGERRRLLGAVTDISLRIHNCIIPMDAIVTDANSHVAIVSND